MITVIVASGMTGGLAVVLAKLNKQQVTLQKKSESWVEVEALSQRISRILYNKTACLNTIQNDSADNPIAFNPGVTSVSLGHIKNNGGQSIISQNGIYGNRLIKVVSLALEDITVVGNVGKMNLQVTLEKISQSITGYKKTVRTYPLMANLDAANQPMDCASDLSSAIATTRRELCTELGGVYNGPGASPVCGLPLANKTCSPPQYPVGFDASGNLQCVSLPSGPSKPHPTGFNCFLLTLYRGEHGRAGELFQPIDDNAVAVNDGDTTDVARRERWKINDNCPSPPTEPGTTEYTCNLSLGSVNKSHTIKICPVGYSNRFINPLGTLNDAISDSLAVSGAHGAYVQHYCCR